MVNHINLVDENYLESRALARTLESHGFQTGVFSCAQSFLRALPPDECSLTFVSFGLPDQGAKQILDHAQAAHVRTLIVMISRGVETSRIVDAIKLGAEDVLEKPHSVDALLSLVERLVAVAESRNAIRPTIPHPIANALTAEEQTILALLEQGAMIKEIAAKLDISVRTVHYRKTSIFAKTACRNRTEAVARLNSMRSNGAGNGQPSVVS